MAKKAAFLLFRGFEMLDFYGPVSVLGSHTLNGAYQILTVSETAGPVASSIGISTVTEYDFQTCPKPDILVLVGGFGTRKEIDNKQLINFIKRFGPPPAGSPDSTPNLLTVCTGSALAARAGSLDGRNATTNKGAWEWATAQGPETAWALEARWVVDGPVWTSAGVTAGTDMALAYVMKHHGEQAAEEVAGFLEYTGDFRNDRSPIVHVKRANTK
ncbi:g3149 [Coccomyxa viridis]|uniref:G3149 protein n=1 Tax=Coccomyxa viridis TaxID=1274662 RepID=A0ABP1FQ26_9CHLO